MEKPKLGGVPLLVVSFQRYFVVVVIEVFGAIVVVVVGGCPHRCHYHAINYKITAQNPQKTKETKGENSSHKRRAKEKERKKEKRN